MRLTEFDKKLIAARPDTFVSNTRFTDTVMARITKSEILSSSIRTMNVNKKETFMMRIKHLPAFALIAIVIASLMIVSGGVYAAYQLLWPKPEVHISQPTTSVSGRQEVAVSLEQCGGANLASRYELKKNATITAEEVPMVVKAQCELAAIGIWADKTFPHNDDAMESPQANVTFDTTRLSTSMATYIKSKDNSSITFVGLTKYNQTDSTFPLTQDVRYIADGHDVAANAINSNDAVVYITSELSHMTPLEGCNDQHCSITGSVPVRSIVAVVKLVLPFKYYDQFAWQSLAERNTCQGNPADSCLSGYTGGIDLYIGNALPKIGESEMKEIQGVITQVDGSSVTIRSSSGTLFTITTPTNIISTYNMNKASRYYNNQTIKEGSSLSVTYAEKANQHSKDISSGILMSVRLQIEIVGKSDPITSY